MEPVLGVTSCFCSRKGKATFLALAEVQLLVSLPENRFSHHWKADLAGCISTHTDTFMHLPGGLLAGDSYTNASLYLDSHCRIRPLSLWSSSPAAQIFWWEKRPLSATPSPHVDSRSTYTNTLTCTAWLLHKAQDLTCNESHTHNRC